jgi:hypothetical protein
MMDQLFWFGLPWALVSLGAGSLSVVLILSRENSSFSPEFSTLIFCRCFASLWSWSWAEKTPPFHPYPFHPYSFLLPFFFISLVLGIESKLLVVLLLFNFLLNTFLFNFVFFWSLVSFYNSTFPLSHPFPLSGACSSVSARSSSSLPFPPKYLPL